jgi:hypothetical protein
MEMQTQTVDITPTWSEILPSILILHKSQSQNARELAVSELERMARLADKWVAHMKQDLQVVEQLSRG